MGFVETLRGMSDAELLGSLDRAVGRGRRITAEVLAHLGEVEARRLYLDAACSSLFAYCTDRLRLDAGAAYKRILAARAARRFPVILQMVSDGRLHLAGTLLLAPHLTPANHEELLAAATNKSKRKIEGLLADRAPKPPLPSRIRKLPEPSQPPARQAPLDLSDHPLGAGERSGVGAPGTTQEPSSAPRAVTGAGRRTSAVSEGVQASVSAPPASSQPGFSAPATSHSAPRPSVSSPPGSSAPDSSQATSSQPGSSRPGFSAPAISPSAPRPSAPRPSASSPPDSMPSASSPTDDPTVPRSQQPSSAPPQPPRPEPPTPRVRGTVAPLGNRRHRVEFTASDALVGKLERARALLSHKLPGSDIADVIEQALTDLVERLEKERFGVRGSGTPRGRAKATPEGKRRAKDAGCGAGTGRPQVALPTADGREPATEDHDPRLDASPTLPGHSSNVEAQEAAGAGASPSPTVPGGSSGGEADEAPIAGAASPTVPGDSSGGEADEAADAAAATPTVPGDSYNVGANEAADAAAVTPTVPGDSSNVGAEEAAGAGASPTVPGDSSGSKAEEAAGAGAGASPTVPGDSSRAPLGPRRVPMAVRRAVYERDGARCTHTDAEGRRCDATHHLQLDHVVPWARGGASNVSNIRLLCRQHNLHAARRSFGPALIDRRIERARGGGR